ncbi:MAG: hydrogenase 4 subunit F, partial [Mariprofundaceae bacterium]|nr:hydrogenase 4 subunit F [Mariprofundaceae bacterium]
MNLFFATLLSPLLGGLLLGIINNPKWAARLNIATGVSTFTFAVLLAIQVLGVKSFDAMGGWFHLDAYNVFLIA